MAEWGKEVNDLLGWGGGAEAVGKGAGEHWQSHCRLAMGLKGCAVKVPQPSRAVPGQAGGPAFILPLCTKQNSLDLEHPCFTLAPLPAVVTCPQDNLAQAMEMTRSVLYGMQ